MHRLMVLLVSFLVTAVPAQLIAGDNNAEEFAKSYEDQVLLLRPTHTMSRTAYFGTEDGRWEFEYEGRYIFPVHSHLQVTINDVKTHDDEYEFHVRHESLGKGKLILRSETGADIDEPAVKTFVKWAFVESISKDTIVDFVGNRATKTVHAAVCNHTPKGANAHLISTLEEASELGYRPCSICFHQRPDISGYDVEMFLGDQTAAEVRRLSPVSHNDSLNAIASRAGHAVLSDWPIPLKGYEYEFQVIEDDAPNAIACPGGRVYVTSALMDAIETSAELEGILAHEIAHVELRHGYRQYKRAKKAELLGTIAAVTAGVIAAKKSDSPITTAAVMDITASLASLASAIVLSGYSVSAEEEADGFAIAYLKASDRYGDSGPFVNTMKKLQYYADVMNIPEGSSALFRTHPYTEDRISRVESSETGLFPANQLFVGMDEEGNQVATLEFQMEMYSDFYRQPEQKEKTRSDYYSRMRRPKPEHVRELLLYATLETTPQLGEREQIKDIRIRVGDDEFKFDNKEDTEVLPDDFVGCVFVSDKPKGRLNAPIDEIQCDMKNVRNWVRRLRHPDR